MLDVDLHLRRGAFSLAAQFAAPLAGISVLFGPSGAGKSLLLSALAGLLKLDRGRVVMAGRVLDDVGAGMHAPPHRRGVGLVFQDARLFPHLSVKQNLAFAARRAPTESRFPSLTEIAERFDIAALLSRPVRNLSGGEKSRVALARALLSAPDLLLLDEPFAALDGARRYAFLTLLRQIHTAFDLPMMVVTHQIADAAALGDHMVALKAGNVVTAGALKDVALSASVRAMLDPRDIGAAVPAQTLTTGFRAEADIIWVRADHVLLAREQPRAISARNVWPARIVSVASETPHTALIAIDTPAGALLSRVTAAAAAELDLAPNLDVWAIVKAHSL